MHDIHVAVAKHYVENLKEEVKKGMREKAEQGLYPGRAAFGYRNNPTTRAIDVDVARGPVVKRIFEFYATGDYSLKSLKATIFEQTGIRINRAYLETMLKNPFYIGRFIWREVEYKGTHTLLVRCAETHLFKRGDNRDNLYPSARAGLCGYSRADDNGTLARRRIAVYPQALGHIDLLSQSVHRE